MLGHWMSSPPIDRTLGRGVLVESRTTKPAVGLGASCGPWRGLGSKDNPTMKEQKLKVNTFLPLQAQGYHPLRRERCMKDPTRRGRNRARTLFGKKVNGNTVDLVIRLIAKTAIDYDGNPAKINKNMAQEMLIAYGKGQKIRSRSVPNQVDKAQPWADRANWIDSNEFLKSLEWRKLRMEVLKKY